MKLFRKFLLVIAIVLFCIPLRAQNNNYIAYFDNTDETVYRDKSDRLVMSYRITGPESEAAVDQIRYDFARYSIFESFTITSSTEEGSWNVTETTNPGVKLKAHKKLFILSGISTIYVNGEPYPVETFKRKMLKTN